MMASSKRSKKRPLSLSLSQPTLAEASRTRKKSNVNHVSTDVSKDDDSCSINGLFVVREDEKDNPKRKLVEEWLEKSSNDLVAVENGDILDETSQETVLLERNPSSLAENTKLAENANLVKGISHSEGVNFAEISKERATTSGHTENIEVESIDLAESTSPTSVNHPANINHPENIKHTAIVNNAASTNRIETKKSHVDIAKETDVSSSSSKVPDNKYYDELLLQCPLCWKIFERTQTQAAHLKACASEHGLTPRQLIDAVELHKKQLAERRKLGLTSAVPPPAAAKKTTTKKSRAPKDSNLQLALALSLSLATEGQQREERQEALTTFGFTAKSNGPKKSGSAPVLLSRSQAERERLITEKVAIVLMDDGGGSQPIVASAENRPTVQSSQLREWSNEENPLWKKSSSSPSQTDSSTYYVGALDGVIAPSDVKPGAKLRHLSQVPGRMNTPKKAPRKYEEKEDESSVSDCRTPTNATSSSKLEQKIKDKLFSDWSSMLKNDTMSDVRIYVRGGLGIPAHKLVLAVRCPGILRNVTEQRDPVTGLNVDVILWSDISHNVAVRFLEYLYYGSIRSIHTLRSDLNELRSLAGQYEASDLLYALASLENKDRPKWSSERFRRRQLLSDAESEKNERALPLQNELSPIADIGKRSVCSLVKTPDDAAKKTVDSAVEELKTENVNVEPSVRDDISIYSQRTTCAINLIHSPDPFSDSAPSSPSPAKETKVGVLSQSEIQSTTNRLSKPGSDICSISTIERKASISSSSKSGSDEISSGKTGSPVPSSIKLVIEDSGTSFGEERLSHGSGKKGGSDIDYTSVSERKSSVAASTKQGSDSDSTPISGRKSSLASLTKPGSEFGDVSTIRRLSTNSSFKAGSETDQTSNQFELRLSSGSSRSSRSRAGKSKDKASLEGLDASFSSGNLPPFSTGANRSSPQSSDDDVVILSDDELGPSVFTQKESCARISQASQPPDLETPSSPKSVKSVLSGEEKSPYISPIWNGFEDVQYNMETHHSWKSHSNDEISDSQENRAGKKIHDVSSSSPGSDDRPDGGDAEVHKRMLDDSMNAVLASSILERAVSESEAHIPLPELKRNERGSPDSGRVTPMKNYKEMTSPEIKVELRNFGLKTALSKRKGILILEHIYNELHPWVPVGEEDRLVNGAAGVLPLFQPPSGNHIPNSQASTSSSSSSSSGDEFSDVESSDSDSAIIRSQRTFHKLSPADLPDVVKKHLEKDPVLFRKTLEYEPIFVERLYSDLRASGYKLKISDLMACLGEKCINYRSVKAQGGGKRKRKQNGNPQRKPRLDLEEDV